MFSHFQDPIWRLLVFYVALNCIWSNLVEDWSGNQKTSVYSNGSNYGNIIMNDARINCRLVDQEIGVEIKFYCIELWCTLLGLHTSNGVCYAVCVCPEAGRCVAIIKLPIVSEPIKLSAKFGKNVTSSSGAVQKGPSWILQSELC